MQFEYTLKLQNFQSSKKGLEKVQVELILNLIAKFVIILSPEMLC